MNLPISQDNLVAWIDPDQKFSNLNVLAAPNLLSITNRVGFQSVSQATSANQPTYVKQGSAYNSQYMISCAPTQYLAGTMAGGGLLSGTNAIWVAFVASSTSNIANNMVSLYWSGQGTNAKSQFLVKQIASTGVQVTRIDNSGTTDTCSATGVFPAGQGAVISAMWDTSNITLRVNGVQVAQTATTGGAITLDTLVIGAGAANEATPYATGFTGLIGDVVVNSGDQEFLPTENYLSLKFNAPNAPPGMVAGYP